jgi:hypothetical protein
MADKIEILDKNDQKVEGNSITEKLFFVERFYHKNRKKLIFSAVVLVVGGASYLTDNFIKDYRNDVANKAYYSYSKGVEVEASLEIIKELNPKLFSLIQFSKAIKDGNKEKLTEFSKSKSQILSDLAEYQLISLNKDVQALNSYSYKDRAIFRDLAIISEAYTLIKQGKTEDAQNRLDFIADGSSLKEIAKYLLHFGAVSKYYDASADQLIRDDLNQNGVISE